jgi:hypothetical protein
MDTIYLAIALGFFVVTLGLVRLCAVLGGDR